MSGIIDQTSGLVKETLGNLTGNDKLKEEGHSQHAKAIGKQKLQENEDKRQEKVDEVKNDPAVNKAKGGAMGVTGAVEEKLGKLTGNTEKQQQGHERRAEGAGEVKLSEQEQEEKRQQESGD
ncbi:hypothetical protein COEREDRAFT_80284 [Coemansia reversa NRRL 1564]|uniref:CsbD-like domain-containing protein n=1 Tax=Coemansia reversa (strain ATCC 12441 / NRRL 1564) TaxID=763665 RepID=A0A2G5BG89_COERN|nr:hypothetical protein COEREDRAFT_80284 [Coemansia reversa NRRL 1564]|eukprot:PIA17992.1 hypothetical protein COEREDRAFT_80284 [Coemansia reversa NRRL 1564]